MDNNWISINERKPQDSERVLVWDGYWGEPRILTYNDYYRCWDDESGDDFECELDATENASDDGLRIEFWQSLPDNPSNCGINQNH